jgi:hypothetical protein
MDESLPKVKVMPNDVFLDEVRKLIQEGHSVTLRVKGNSMLPFIYGGRDNVRFVKCSDYQVLDIVLAEVSIGVFVVHRIISIEDNQVTLMGDGNVCGVEHCHIDNLAGRVEVIIRGTREINPYSWCMRNAVKFWWYIRRLRRWLLAFMRLTVLKNKVQNN